MSVGITCARITYAQLPKSRCNPYARMYAIESRIADMQGRSMSMSTARARGMRGKFTPPHVGEDADGRTSGTERKLLFADGDSRIRP